MGADLPVPIGYLLGRTLAGAGPPQQIPFAWVAEQLVSYYSQSNAAAITAAVLTETLRAEQAEANLQNQINAGGGGGGSPPTVTTGIAAVGSSQGTATPLTTTWNAASSTSINYGVLLLALNAGAYQRLTNTGNLGFLVYPAVGQQIGSAGVNIAVEIEPGATVDYCGYGGGQCYAR